ncbi:MAG: hypothetical protein H0W90_08740 [Actinobacteria bacterium]|nr:hypothetical protein [Actinomycetota bacterium]
MRRPKYSATPVSDEELGAMLGAFAGPGEPLLRQEQQSLHRTSRRAIVVAAVVVFALALSVPALALHEDVAQSVREFLAKKSEPKNAKEEIEGVARGPLQAFPLIKGTLRRSGSTELPYKLTSVRQVVAANTPQGEIRLYELRFSNGYRGSAMVSVADRGVSGASWGPDTPCPRGWALKAGGSFVTLPGRTPLFVTGRVGDEVASVEVTYPDGHTSRAAVGGGYVLAWVIPTGNTRDPANYSPPVNLVARNTAGKELGHIFVRSDGDVPPSPGQPAQAVACG